MGGADSFWAWLETESGRDEEAGLREFVTEAAPEDPRASIAVARLQALQRRYESL